MTRDEAVALERKVAQAVGLHVNWCMVRECFVTISGEEFRPLRSNNTAMKVMHQLKVMVEWDQDELSMQAIVNEENKVLVYQMAGSSIEDLRHGIASLAAYYAEQAGLVV